MTSEERPFRLEPRRPTKQRRDEIRVWSSAFKRLFHVVRMSTRRSGHARQGVRPPPSYSQRCAVRVTYSANKAPGQWRAHGRYLARESATKGERGIGMGFGPGPEPVNVSSSLDHWQTEGDQRMFKLIISPEFGDRLNLETHTRTLMSQMERDLGTALEWVAVAHYNTSHPHVHIALRGRNENGEALRLERDYIRVGLRRRAEELCTNQLGYRTELDAQEAQRREIDQYRYTSLDRLINRVQARGEDPEDPTHFTFTANPNNPGLRSHLKIQQHHAASRLLVLEKMGLAERAESGSGTWRVRRDFEDALRAMQRANDRQKTLAAHGSLLSDPRLTLQVTPPSALGDFEGRVLGHGQEDSTDRSYVLVEGTDAKVHFIYHDEGIDSARHQGLLRVNSFVRLRKDQRNGRPSVRVDDLGDAEKILSDKRHLRSRAQLLIASGIGPDEVPRWGGWLGRYQAKLHSEISEIHRSGQHSERRPPGNLGRV